MSVSTSTIASVVTVLSKSMLDEDPSSLAGIGSESLCVATRSGRDEWRKSVMMSKVEVEDKDEESHVDAVFCITTDNKVIARKR